VQIYSVGYMAEEPRFTWYFAALSLFTGAMLNLVIANNLFQLLLGWEGVGLCSYLLIGYYYDKPSAREAAKKAGALTVSGEAGTLHSVLGPGARLPVVLPAVALLFTAGETTYEGNLTCDVPAFTATPQASGDVGA
jgi:NADH-quinone oxidoreductase subunit L